MGAGAVAGLLGALLGLGGGVFLVPFLNIVLGLPFKVAGAISLMTVIATSSAVSARSAGRQLINLRLGMLLEVASAAGGLAGRRDDACTFCRSAFPLVRDSDRPLRRDHAQPAGAAGTCSRRAAIPVVSAAATTTMRAGVKWSIGSSGCRWALSCRAWPAPFRGVRLGGGILKVPVVNVWCGVPMRAAAATSGLMIGVTAVASVPIHYARGYICRARRRGGPWRARRITRRVPVRRQGARALAEAADGRCACSRCRRSTS